MRERLADPGPGGFEDAAPEKELVVAMPAYNEEAFIGSMVLKCRRFADKVLVIDDGSSDGTAAVAAMAGAEVIRHETNRGKGAAVRTLLQRVREIDPDVMVILDSDSQHDAAEIPVLAGAVREGLDFVVGSRRNVKQSIPFYRRIGQRVLLDTTRTVAEHNLTDSESGFRAFSRRAVHEMELKQDGFAVESEMIAVAVEKGFKIGEVPITVRYHKDGSTLNPVRHGMDVLSRIMVMISERRPLFFFGSLGMIIFLIGVFFGARTVNIFVQTGGIIPLGTIMLTAIFIIVGMFLGLTGIILYALAKRR